jgi:hypothetical protein
LIDTLGKISAKAPAPKIIAGVQHSKLISRGARRHPRLVIGSRFQRAMQRTFSVVSKRKIARQAAGESKLKARLSKLQRLSRFRTTGISEPSSTYGHHGYI